MWKKIVSGIVLMLLSTSMLSSAWASIAVIDPGYAHAESYVVAEGADWRNTNFPNQRKLAITSDGHLHAVYHRKDANGILQIYHAESSDGGKTWTEEQITYASRDQCFPALAADSKDSLHLVWEDGRHYQPGIVPYTYYKKRTASSWQDAELVASYATIPSIAIDSKDNVHVVYGVYVYRGYWGGGNGIRWRMRTSAGWQPEEIVSSINIYWERWPAIAIDSNDNVHVVWDHAPRARYYDTHYRKRTSSGWGPEIEVARDSDATITFPSIAIDSHDYVHIVWHCGESGSISIRYRRYTDSWQQIEIIEGPEYTQFYPTIAIDGKNNVHVVWCGKHAGSPDIFQIRHRKFTTSWQPIEELTASTLYNQSFPSLMWAFYPIINGVKTNQLEEGCSFIWMDGTTIKYWTSAPPVPPLPMTVYGYVFIGEETAPEGIYVYAKYVNQTQLSNTTTKTDGSYTLIIPPEGTPAEKFPPEGIPLDLWVETFNVTRITFKCYTILELNLTITLAPIAAVASFTYSPAEPVAEEAVTFDASSSYDPDGGPIVNYCWEFYRLTEEGAIIYPPIWKIEGKDKVVVSYSFGKGDYLIVLTVTDDEGVTSKTSKTLHVHAPLTCVVKLQKDGVEIDEIDVGEFFDIYVGDSIDGKGIKEVRFSSDDSQDGVPTGEWTEWFNWSDSFEDWNAEAKIMRWAFATPGYKEVWTEVRDDLGQTDRCYANIFVHPGYAIIVSGGGIWKSTFDHCANNAYRVLRNLGFDDDHIFYLNCKRPQDIDRDGDDEVDAPASLSDFENVLNEIKVKRGENPVLLIIYLVGHGVPDAFLFDGDDLLVWKLKEKLDEFSSDTRMLIVINSCYSGSFIAPAYPEHSVSATNRIIITTTHNDQHRGIADWYFGQRHAFVWVRSSDRFWGNLNKGLNVKEAFTQRATPGDNWHLWLDDNGDKIGHPPNNLEDDGALAAATEIGIPGMENLKLTPWQYFWKRSPGELRVYDSQNRVTGLVNGTVREEIPDSMYDEENEVVAIFSSYDIYRCEIAGTVTGTYGLDVASVENGNATIFTAIDIPTSVNAIHQYFINWTALSLGEEGVTIMVDSDGDGVFEHTFASDSELTHDEFMLQTATTIDFDPDTLNLKSKGKWITCYIELPEGYNVSDINIGTILLNQTIPVDPLAPTQIGDYDGDGIPDLMVKFNRTAVSEFILSKGIMTGNVTLTITGQLSDGTLFKGRDVIKVRMPGDIDMNGKVDMRDILLAAKAFGSYPQHPRWNPIADENEDNQIDLKDICSQKLRKNIPITNTSPYDRSTDRTS